MAELRDVTFGNCVTIRKTVHRFSRDFNAMRRRAVRLSGALTFAALSALLLASTAPVAGHAAILSVDNAGGYSFTNFDPSLTGTAVGSNVNGISNTGQAVGTEVDAAGAPTGVNFAGTAINTNPLNTGAGQTAFGINSAGSVVGGNGTTAFILPQGGALQTLAAPPGATNAFGINDLGNIVGQSTIGNNNSGFYLPSASSTSFATIFQPTGTSADVVNAQGINDNRLIVGFYLGNDGQVHGFDAKTANISNGSLVGTAIADPTIPSVRGEPGATFVFSQLLGVNDAGIAVGYYGDSTTSQHGYLYNTATGVYTFLDDPAAAFHNGVEVTQITGITNSGEIAGFYTDAGGVAHSFTAGPTVVAVPEPSTWLMALAGFGFVGWRARRASKRSRLASI
jgi:hypothetical protein